jgi:deoxycytidylate deaminase
LTELKDSVTENSQHELLKKIDNSIDDLSDAIATSAYEDTRLSGLIEFSRAVHAEMDAIVSLAFNGGGRTEGATLFTYTFPCHNCARHIAAAGIARVFYLEPYEKSLAIELHGDAIDVDGQHDGLSDVEKKRVKFIHFEGVAPRQYLNMFTPLGERKSSDGKAMETSVRETEKKIPEYLDDYRKYELKVVEHLSNIIDGLKGSKNSLPTSA